MLSVVVGAGIGGGLISALGYYWPFLVGGPIFICIGSGLLYTVRADSSSATLIGYQILLGGGVGVVLQNTLSSSSVPSLWDHMIERHRDVSIADLRPLTCSRRPS